MTPRQLDAIDKIRRDLDDLIAEFSTARDESSGSEKSYFRFVSDRLERAEQHITHAMERKQ